MNTLTVKAFVKEFVLNLLIFFAICVLYSAIIIYPRSFSLNLLKSMLETFPVFIYGLFYCILFYHLVFYRVLLRTPVKQLLSIIAILVAGFFICDVLFVNYLSVTRHQFKQVIWYHPAILFRFALFTAYAFAYSYVKGLSFFKFQKLQAENDKTTADLKNLRSQMAPHFIFNSLNSIYALSMEEKAVKTSESIEELAGLFRYVLKEEQSDLVPVQEELEFIEKYIHLNEIRIDQNERIKLESSIQWDKKPAMLSPMLLLSFIENAFKHGISYQRPSFIDIIISVIDGQLNLQVKNSLHVHKTTPATGRGLKNTHGRLVLLYPGKYSLSEENRDGTYEVSLSINLK